MKINTKNYKDIIVIISSFIMGGIFMLFIVRYTPLVQHVIGSSNNYIVKKDETKIYEKGSLSKSVEKIYDAVVVIESYENNSLNGTGTGFIYKVDSKYAYIITNQHVIENTSKPKIIFSNDEYTEAKILGKDEFLDLAVLRVDKKYASLIATIGKSMDMNLGDTIFVVGTPLGYNYRGTVTSGVLSGKDRMVKTTISSTNNNEWIMRVLQFDASINPGNSGGPLLNVNGEVIGVCSLKLVDDEIEGMGFAIPIEYAMSHVDTLEKGKKIEWPVLGIGMINVNDSAGKQNNNISVPKNITEGVIVLNIKEKTGAAKSDLKKGDIIIKVDGKDIKDTAYLRYELYQHQASDTIEITYIRNNKERTTKVKLSSE